jgi:hypothetical protein
MAMPNKKKSENYGRLDERGRRTKAKEEERQKEMEEDKNEDLELNPFTTHIAKKCIDKDYILNFMEKPKTKKLMQLYSMDPNVLPVTEIKPLNIVVKINLRTL